MRAFILISGFLFINFAHSEGMKLVNCVEIACSSRKPSANVCKKYDEFFMSFYWLQYIIQSTNLHVIFKEKLTSFDEEMKNVELPESTWSPSMQAYTFLACQYIKPSSS